MINVRISGVLNWNFRLVLKHPKPCFTCLTQRRNIKFFRDLQTHHGIFNSLMNVIWPWYSKVWLVWFLNSFYFRSYLVEVKHKEVVVKVDVKQHQSEVSFWKEVNILQRQRLQIKVDTSKCARKVIGTMRMWNFVKEISYLMLCCVNKPNPNQNVCTSQILTKLDVMSTSENETKPNLILCEKVKIK